MAQERPTTPERELLRLIEDPKAQGKDSDVQRVRHSSLSLFSPGAWLGRISFSKSKLKRWLKGEWLRELDIRAVNRILALCIVFFAICFTHAVYTTVKELEKMPDTKFEVKKDTKPMDFAEVSVLKPPYYYLEQIKKRDIFEFVKLPEEIRTDKKPMVKPPRSRIIAATEHLKLVGISWSDNPDAMIEDTKAMRTFFVKKGEIVDNIEVKAIYKDRVILGCEGDEIELK